jgi:hypothetical protein
MPCKPRLTLLPVTTTIPVRSALPVRCSNQVHSRCSMLRIGSDLSNECAASPLAPSCCCIRSSVVLDAMIPLLHGALPI